MISKIDKSFLLYVCSAFLIGFILCVRIVFNLGKLNLEGIFFCVYFVDSLFHSSISIQSWNMQ